MFVQLAQGHFGPQKSWFGPSNVSLLLMCPVGQVMGNQQKERVSGREATAIPLFPSMRTTSSCVLTLDV